MKDAVDHKAQEMVVVKRRLRAREGFTPTEVMPAEVMVAAPLPRLAMAGLVPFRKRRLGGGQNGVTLIESLIASAILLVVMSAIYSMWAGLHNTYLFTAEDMLAQDQARGGDGRDGRIHTNRPHSGVGA